jgi:hypothetical protein
MNRVLGIVLLFGLIASSSCDISDVGMCSDEYVYGVRVELRFPELNDITEWSGTVCLSAGDYEEELDVLPTPETGRLLAFGAGERPGIYRLAVDGPGYKPWEREGIVVSENVCHVKQVNVTVQLEPE